MQNPDVIMHSVRESGACINSYGSMGPSSRFLLSSWAVCTTTILSLRILYCILQSLLGGHTTSQLPPRVISPRNLRQWFSRYTCSQEQNSRFPFGDTSPADRSLRFHAMTGTGLMARDTLLWNRDQITSSLIICCSFDHIGKLRTLASFLNATLLVISTCCKMTQV